MDKDVYILAIESSCDVTAAYYEYQKGVRHDFDLNAVPNLRLGERI